MPYRHVICGCRWQRVHVRKTAQNRQRVDVLLATLVAGSIRIKSDRKASAIEKGSSTSLFCHCTD